MRLFDRTSNAKFKYKTLVVIASIILVTTMIVLYGEGKKRGCNRENYDSYYFLKALKNEKVKYCERIFMQEDARVCRAMLQKNERLCVRDDGFVDESCIALVKKDITRCKDDIICKAFISKDQTYCKELSEDAKPSLESACRAFAEYDEKFFVSKNQLIAC